MGRPSASGLPGAPPRRRRHRGWTLGLAGLLLAAAAAVALHSPWLKVREVEILGAERAAVAERLEAAGVGRGAFMIWLRPGEIAVAVSADPWVREVRVDRLFPDRLVVEVLEHSPAVWVGSGSVWMLLSRAGVVVAVSESPGDRLLRARVPYDAWKVGEQPWGPEWGELIDLALTLSPELAEVARVTSEGGELWLAARGYRARLGSASDLADKGRAFEALLASELPPGAVIDLVSPTRPAITVPGAVLSGEGEAVVEGEDGG